MKIYSGIFCGAEIEYGINDGTSGQMYVDVTVGGKRLKKILASLDENELRKALNLPDRDGDAFSFHFNKKENNFNWFFMFSEQRGRSQLEYLFAFCNMVQDLYKLAKDGNSEKDEDAKN